MSVSPKPASPKDLQLVVQEEANNAGEQNTKPEQVNKSDKELNNESDRAGPAEEVSAVQQVREKVQKTRKPKTEMEELEEDGEVPADDPDKCRFARFGCDVPVSSGG